MKMFSMRYEVLRAVNASFSCVLEVPVASILKVETGRNFDDHPPD
jgi:hypothetical protein